MLLFFCVICFSLTNLKRSENGSISFHKISFFANNSKSSLAFIIQYFVSGYTQIRVMKSKYEADSLGLKSRRNLRQAISLRSTCSARSLAASSWPLWTRPDRVASAWDRMNDSSTWKHRLLVMFLQPLYSWDSQVHPKPLSCIYGYTILKGKLCSLLSISWNVGDAAC